jgi:glycosyltransferase involved in cell wall biosynthesis
MRTQGRFFEERLDRWGGARFDRIVACSEFVHRFLVDDYGYGENKVVTIRNGWSGVPVKTKSDGLTAICVANFRPAKGHEVLVKAFARVVARFPEAKLILVGSGPLEADIRHLVDRSEISSQVEFVGTVSDVWPELARADVAVLPSYNETFGIAAVEAAAAGLPVVASRVGGLPEVVLDGRTGILVRPGDDVELAEALIAMFADPGSRADMGKAACSMADSLSMKSTVDSYFGLYRDLASNVGKARKE